MTRTDRKLTKVLFEVLETVKSEKRKLEIAKLIVKLNWEHWGLGDLTPEAAKILGLPSGKRPRVRPQI